MSGPLRASQPNRHILSYKYNTLVTSTKFTSIDYFNESNQVFTGNSHVPEFLMLYFFFFSFGLGHYYRSLLFANTNDDMICNRIIMPCKATRNNSIFFAVI